MNLKMNNVTVSILAHLVSFSDKKMFPDIIPTHLITTFVSAAARPKEMSTDADSAALVRLLQQLGGSQRTLSPQRLVVFLAETSHSLKGTDDQCDGCQLGFRVTDLILI